MAERERPLKVCGTCRYWSNRYKGFCARLQQGVGKFWMCEGWCEAALEMEEETVAESQEAAVK